MAWWDVPPEPSFVRCLDAADGDPKAGPWGQLGTQPRKNRWGNVFADACAVMVAREVRTRSCFKNYEVRPRDDGSGTEALTGVGGAEGKKIDVLVSTLASGLQVAVSLKAENFSDRAGKFGKNLMNRLYELSDETRSIHQYQPRAVVVGMFFLPLGAATDRAKRSSFHRTVEAMRRRTGRDPAEGSEHYRLDVGYVGLYAPERLAVSHGVDFVERGALRFLDVTKSAPRIGRPVADDMLDLHTLVDQIAAVYRSGHEEPVPDAEPEQDPS